MNANLISKFSSLFFLLSFASDEKKEKLLKQLDLLGRTDTDFEKIKNELIESDPILWGHFFSIIKKNPAINLGEFISAKTQILTEKEKKEQGKALKYTAEEQEAVKDISNVTAKDWALKALKDSEI